MSKKYNHMIDMAFSIETNEEDCYNIPKPAIISALLSRISSIIREDDSFWEAFSCCDTYEVEERRDEYYESYPNKLPKLIKDMEDTPTHSETMQDELEPIDKDDYFPESKIRGM